MAIDAPVFSAWSASCFHGPLLPPVVDEGEHSDRKDAGRFDGGCVRHEKDDDMAPEPKGGHGGQPFQWPVRGHFAKEHEEEGAGCGGREPAAAREAQGDDGVQRVARGRGPLEEGTGMLEHGGALASSVNVKCGGSAAVRSFLTQAACRSAGISPDGEECGGSGEDAVRPAESGCGPRKELLSPGSRHGCFAREGGTQGEAATAAAPLATLSARPALAAHRVQVFGVPFKKHGTALNGGDFRKMIGLPEYKETLFVFNGNVADDWCERATEGGGSAAVRPFSTQHAGYRSAGIPTGWSPGVPFASLGALEIMAIDWAVHRILNIVQECGYTRVLFPCDATDPTRIGTCIFTVPDRVVARVSERLNGLPDFFASTPRFSNDQLRYLVRTFLMRRAERGPVPHRPLRDAPVFAPRPLAAPRDDARGTAQPLVQAPQASFYGNRPFDAPLARQASLGGERPFDAPLARQASLGGERPFDAPTARQASLGGKRTFGAPMAPSQKPRKLSLTSSHTTL